MVNLVRCKACGLILEDSRVKEVCPACGVPRNAFEAYTEKVSPRRKWYLDLHLHPIAVHFPQACTVFIPMFILGRLLFTTYSFTEDFIVSARILSIILPVSAAGAAAAGVADGRVRFKKFFTPYLKIKMGLASAMILFATGMAVIAATSAMSGMELLPFFALNIGCALCQVFLGKIGVQLMFSVLPG